MKRLGRFVINSILYFGDPDIVSKLPCEKIVERQMDTASDYFIFTAESYQFDEVNEHGPIPTYDIVVENDIFRFKKAGPIEEYLLKDD